jgi:hypothetical protein
MLFWLVGSLLLLVAAVIFALAIWRWTFSRRVDAAILELESRADGYGSRVHADELTRLPPIVSRWLRQAGVVGRARVQVVELTQHGEMQTSRGAKWMPFCATQWSTTHIPGFVWAADVAALPGVSIAGLDRYIAGQGATRIELASLIPIANASGSRIDQGSLVRFLAELIWYPSAALEPYIFWQQIGETAARATICNRGIAASAEFHFDHFGNIVSIEAERYRDETLSTWVLEADPAGYTRLGAMRLPLKWDVSWREEDGDWTWLHLTVDDIRYDGTPLATGIDRPEVGLDTGEHAVHIGAH